MQKRKMMGAIKKRRGWGAHPVRDNLSMQCPKNKNAVIMRRIVKINYIV